MSFEKPQRDQSEDFEKERPEEAKKGVALKAFIAITNGVLNRNVKINQEKGFLISVVQKAEETYKSLNDFEKEIDPSGKLSGEIEESIASGFGKLADWLKKQEGEEKQNA